MSLLDRLANFREGYGVEDFIRVSPIEFWALLAELSQGRVNKAQIVNHLQLTTEEQAELDWLIARYNAQPDAAAKAKFVDLMFVLFVLAERKVPGYTTQQDLVARINLV